MSVHVPCDYCHRFTWLDEKPGPDDEVICAICDDEREDARRDAAYEHQWEEETNR